MLDKYITIEEIDVIVGQDGKTGLWYCKELKAKTTKESGQKMLEMNQELNKANNGIRQEKIKEKPKVKGLK